MPMVEGGRPIARFQLFGFPVTIDISFLVIAAILGWSSGLGIRLFVAWLVLVPLAVLVHELGHAFVARTTGARPVITLAGLGGLTSYLPPRPLSRARSFAISIAGPAVGIGIGVALLALRGGAGAESSMVRSVLDLAVFATLGWSLLNLLPILPLDGGQALRELLPGSPAKREVRAAMVSVVVAVLAALAALRYGLLFGGLMAAFFVFSNVMTIRNARELEQVDVNERAIGLLWAGRPAEARDLLADLPDDAPVHPLVRATVRAAGDDPAAGTAELEAATDRAPTDPQPASLLLLAHRARQDWDAAHRQLAGPRGAVDPGALLGVQTAAFQAGATRHSAELGELFLSRTDAAAPPTDETRALIAYNVACGWARAGELPRGLQAFRRAVDLGFADLTQLDSDDDIAPLRPLPGYDEARQQVRRRALAAAEEQQAP